MHAHARTHARTHANKQTRSHRDAHVDNRLFVRACGDLLERQQAPRMCMRTYKLKVKAWFTNMSSACLSFTNESQLMLETPFVHRHANDGDPSWSPLPAGEEAASSPKPLLSSVAARLNDVSLQARPPTPIGSGDDAGAALAHLVPLQR